MLPNPDPSKVCSQAISNLQLSESFNGHTFRQHLINPAAVTTQMLTADRRLLSTSLHLAPGISTC